MSELRYTLLSDGSSDRALLPILDWLLTEHNVRVPQPAWADLRQMPRPPKNLKGRIEEALRQYPCDLLFIHRDAEREAYDVRKREILAALESVTTRPPAVCVVPVRMQEAWLLISEKAIRYAASNPEGRGRIEMPSLRELEDKPDPKAMLGDLILRATELNGQRRDRFRKSYLRLAPHRVAQYIRENEGFAPLRQLSAFQRLETDVRQLIDEHKWRST